jgi:hypothetical protein
MAHNTRISQAAGLAMINELVLGGFNSTWMYIYTGVQPVTPETPLTDQRLIVQIPLVENFSYPTTNVQTFTNVSAFATGSGIATWFEIKGPPFFGTPVSIQGSVGTSGCDLNLSDVNFTAGDEVILQTGVSGDISGTITVDLS